ncbi:MAG: hypothetical protein AB2L14_23570 [Candidatus Xenobiia bacterium LiM19]
MNTQHYENFIKFQNMGLKAKAKESLKEFIASFSDNNEVAQWVWSYLSEFALNPQISMRYEIFEHLVFPVLLDGYKNNDFQSTLWLGKLIGKLEQVRSLHEKIDFKSDYSLFMECYNRNPDNQEVIELLLQNLVDWFKNNQHEWPIGILYDNNFATLEQCKEIRKKLAFARELDKKADYTEFFNQFEEKLNQHELKISNP